MFKTEIAGGSVIGLSVHSYRQANKGIKGGFLS